eukprot:JP446276.1.p1 GENE.JP446276.1~~JP446276.1.p1  ORF type:complete len:421 (+),score=171.67 JP446276.1:36-1265(+)
MLRCVLALLALAAICAAAKPKPLFSSTSSDVVVLTSLNFNAMIKKNRDDHVSMVAFVSSSDSTSKALVPEWSKLATDLKGIVRFGAVDCDQETKLCSEYSATTFPALKLFPTGSYKFVQDYTGEKTAAAITKYATKHVKGSVKMLDANSFEDFITANVSKPHAMLFTDKTKAPLLFRALSNDFKGRMLFGLIPSSEKALVARYKVKKIPAVVLVKGEKSGTFKGELKYETIFTWLNNYVETFTNEVQGNEDADAGPKKPWKNEVVPKVTKDSFPDICLTKKGLCVISFLNTQNGAPSKEDLDIITSVKDKFESQIQRGTSFFFMYVDPAEQPQLAAGFSVSSQPSVIILNPGKRKRYALHSGEFTKDGLIGFLDKATGGDLRFVPVSPLPPLFNLLRSRSLSLSQTARA